MPVPRSSTISHQQLFQADPVLKALAAELSPQSWASTENVFHDLCSCIIEQQIHYRSSKYVFQRLMQEAGLDLLTPENFHQMEPVLPSMRLSETKYEALARTHSFFSESKISWQRLSDEEVRRELAQIKGIGHWTVDMILLYTLHRPDIFPTDDYHLTQIMTRLYGLDPKKRLRENMLRIAEGWAGHRSLGVLYLLAWKDQHIKRRKQ
ncbi:MAG TPA: hypothetical protein VFR58_07615 [Flavisolibacter sp.]|nr:hypothetical protein [Flavisolibacter sp.]